MLTKSICIKFYKRADIQQAMLDHARNKEIGVRYQQSFGKRPDILTYHRDILELALRGTTSFHASEERWSNPLSLNANLNKQELQQLRIGWDLVLDIDCAVMEYSRICADLIIKFLRYCGVKDISVKFSGNKGFHIGVPFEAFPAKVQETQTKELFPEAPKKIALYVADNIKHQLAERILLSEGNDFSKVKEKVQVDDIIYYQQNEFGDKVASLDVEKFLEIDTVLISSRHLYRMPYSLHEKSGLCSLPIEPDKILNFEKPMALPENIPPPTLIYLNRETNGESARELLIRAYDYDAKLQEERLPEIKEYDNLVIESPIREEFFPPCMILILKGLEDGKKRSLFCLMNFLGKIGWNKKEIEQFLLQWNKQKNKEPLRDNYLLGQINYHKPGEKLPPNCNNDAYYKGIQVCQPNTLCKRIKNPVNYTLIRWKHYLKMKEEEEKRVSKEKKKEEREKQKHSESRHQS